jgi:hypothetical protein
VITKQPWETDAYRARMEVIVQRKAQIRRDQADEDAAVALLRDAMDRQDWDAVIDTFDAYTMTTPSEAS